MSDIYVLQFFHGQELQFRVELGQPVLGQETQQVQTQDLVLVRGLGQQRAVVKVVALELGHVALEGGDITLFDAPQRADLQSVPGQ